MTGARRIHFLVRPPNCMMPDMKTIRRFTAAVPWLFPALLAAILILPGGCAVKRKRLIVSLDRPLPPPTATGPAAARPAPQPFQPPTEIQVLRLTLPLGTFSANQKVWSMLEHNVASGKTTAWLSANGLRAGTATFSVWKKIVKLINKPGSTNQRIYCQVNGVRSVALVVRPNVRREILVYHTLPGGLVVRTYRNCDDVILLAAHENRKIPATIVQIEPAVNLGTVTFRRGPLALGIVRGVRPLQRVFTRLRISVAIPPRRFLVIAPSDPRGRPLSVGSAFLSRPQHVPPRETVLVFVPMNVR